MASTPAPDPTRVPQNLSDDMLREALRELDSKIRTLHNRAHATAAGSSATYPAHAAALEAKRARLAAQLGPEPDPTGTPPPAQSTWEEIWRGVEGLRQDLRDIV